MNFIMNSIVFIWIEAFAPAIYSQNIQKNGLTSADMLVY